MDLQTIDATSETYLGQWKRLVSTTNWDKGRIISEWRASLEEAEAPVAEFSDEAWSKRVGNVTPQHVGRLRRVFDKFNTDRETYPGLYWSHFQAALDWDDAEMWLEGAVQSQWSIGEMRKARWQAMGAPAELKPRESDIITAELDEDSEPMTDLHHETALEASLAEVRGPADAADDEAPFDDTGDYHEAPDDKEQVPAVVRQPFADLPSLPADVTDAFESFKLCILRHRLAGWQEVSLDDVLATLDALKELASAPAE